MPLCTGAGDHTREQYPQERQARRAGRRRAIGIVAAAVAALGATAAATGSASAASGQFTQVLCADPTANRGVGGGLPTEIEVSSNNSRWNATASLSTCPQRYILSNEGIGISASGGSYAVGTYTQIKYKVPNGLELRAGHIYRAMWNYAPNNGYIALNQNAGNETGNIWAEPIHATERGDWFAGNINKRGVTTSSFPAENRVDLKVHPTNGWTIIAACVANATTCDWSDRAWEYRIYGGRMTLYDASDPSVSNLSGSMANSSTLRGSETVEFTASDIGSGVYRAALEVDGTVLARNVIDPNSGRCASLSTTDAYVFERAVPCKLNVGSGRVTFDTTRAPEGVHNVRVLVEDASGNQTIALSRRVEIDNLQPPTSTAAPTIAGSSAKVGVELTGTPGTWSATPTASVAYQWFRCLSSARAGDGVAGCDIIDGATAATYTPTSSDAYRRLTLRVTASNSEGTATAFSSPSPIVADEDGSTTSTLPVLTAAPQINGKVQVGSRVTVTTGTWRSSALVASFEYQWRVDGLAVEGATSSSFVPTVDQAYKQLSVVVTARNRNGSTSTTVDAGAIADTAGRTTEPRDEVREGEQERPPTPPSQGGEQPAPTPPAQPAPGPTPAVGQLNGSNAGPNATVTAAFAKGRKKLVVAAGKGAKVSGRLINSATRRPIGNAVLTMITTAPGRRAATKTVKTTAAGTFAVKLPRSATSSTIAFRYTERVGGATAASTKVAGEARVSLTVRSRLSWKASSAKRVLKFTGSISRPVPVKGKQFVEVQWKRGKTWATLAHPVAVNKKGQWTLKYAVGTNVRTGQRFQFRAAIRTTAAGYPFAASSTKAKWVRVK